MGGNPSNLNLIYNVVSGPVKNILQNGREALICYKNCNCGVNGGRGAC
jgi:hypothetical protein